MIISVIMIVHNREKMVSNMIEDILGQSFGEYEFIIIDNCSQDGSGRIADDYAKQDERIKVTHLVEDISVGAARNEGIKMAGGQYVAFVDDDDRVTPDYLESLYNRTEKGKYDISLCASDEIKSGIRTPFVKIDTDELLSGKDAVMELLKRRKIRAPLPSKLIRRELFMKYPFREDTVHDDVHVVYKYLADANGIAVDSTPRYLHVRHDLNISSFVDESKQFTRDVISEYYEAYMSRKAYLESKFPEMYEYLVYNVASYMISMCDKINRFRTENCDEVYNDMIQYLRSTENSEAIRKYATWKELELYEALK